MILQAANSRCAMEKAADGDRGRQSGVMRVPEQHALALRRQFRFQWNER
jgi:hypothetical protein